ncbi:MAG: TlyA family RNA methyltransferase [Anaerolineae bacterium]|nr:TlyA family RNA methyltransferase [Thermoflexales bacterium]MDW8406799.1 TlyA family RNA methyltransferase [Anaerolineae bacterium]
MAADTPSSKIRLDVLLVARGLADTRDWAQRLIRAGEVRVNGQVVETPSKLYPADVEITVANPPKYVSRGGFKLEAALDQFHIDPFDLTCADVGSSTGGFTDCLLQRGARRVYAIDVGQHQLHWKLRNNPRVVVMEQINARYLETLPEPIDLAVIDVSFISLTLILPKVFAWLRAPAGQVIALIKPQFEAGPNQVGKGGIVRDPAVHQHVIDAISAFCAAHGWQRCGLIESPLLGAEGNKEFLIWLGRAQA